eukprot:GDKI01025641.1.p1 GENE.GDKI01025641.1~~GDKI01025641.1.p1  ORF type:complete len:181 (+),score=56.63 GDKI01025641.1:67-609(+)
MPGIRPVRHRVKQWIGWKPAKAIAFKRMNYFTWPPDDCSTMHPIEPWGRQFFVFNAFETVDPNTWGGPQGAYPQIPPKLGPDGNKIPTQTVLCVADFARRPLMYLTKDDLAVLAANLGEMKEELVRFREKMENEKELDKDEHYHMQRLLLPHRSYAMQRTKKGEHASYGIAKGVFRERKT